LLRQWLAGYEDVYDAERLRRDPATRAGQAEGVIQLAMGQQSRIGGDHAAAKLKHQAARRRSKSSLSEALVDSPLGSIKRASVDLTQDVVSYTEIVPNLAKP
jgi:hypothetical protein